LALKAVVFDYGMVLSNAPHTEHQQEILRITGLTEKRLDEIYWIDRHAYDRGEITGLGFWQKLVAYAKLDLSEDQVHQLNHQDSRMWTTVNPEMLAWHQQLKEKGLQTGILSNMGDTVLESIESSFPWIQDFDVLIWSYQHNLAKPEPEIYQLLLQKLGTAPEETLFLDDKLVNIEAAEKLGIRGLQFSTVAKLREDLIASGFDQWLPLP